jgi:hypothetical protein
MLGNASPGLMLGLAVSLASVSASPVSAQQIWLSPRVGIQDFSRLFQDDVAWANVQRHTAYFEFNGNPRDFQAGDLRHIFDYLQQRHIGLAVGLLAVSGNGSCGIGVEGYSSKGDPLRIAKQLKSLGAAVDYFVMDEPLWFGHNFNGRNACHASIDDIAREAAAKVADVLSVFPTAQIGDIEPMGVPNANWPIDLGNWLVAFRAHAGRDLAFVRADMQWTRPWQSQMREIELLLHMKGIPLQVIYNGDGATDLEWAAAAVRRFEEFEATASSPPVPVFMSWAPHPSRALPETDGDTLTGIASRYIKWRALHR